MPARPLPATPRPTPEVMYSGPNVPSAYDSNWQFYTNLTPDQIAWFQAQPEWQNFLAYVALSPPTASAGTPVAVVNGALLAAGQILSTAALPSPLQPIVTK